MRATIAILGLVSLFAGLQPASANSIVNGSFESPVLTVPSFKFDLLPGDPTITGWTITTGSVDLITDTCCGAADTGHQFIDLVGTLSTGGLSQQFATVANQTYNLSFAYSNNPGASASASASAVITDDAAIPNTLLSTVVSHASNDPYSHFLAQFVASSALTTLTFTNLTGGFNGGIFLDSVSVVAATPIPAALPLFASGLGLFGFAAHRRRRKAAFA